KEYVVLHALAFDLDVTFPHLLLNDKIERIVALHTTFTLDQKATLSNSLLKTTWSFLNDSSRTPLCLRLDADDIAAGAVYLAGLLDNTVPDTIVTSDGQPWECVLRPNQEMLIDAATFILEAYICEGIDESKLSPSIVDLLNRFHTYRFMEEVKFEHTSPMSSAGMDDLDNTTDLESDIVNGGTPDDVADKSFEEEMICTDIFISKKRSLDDYAEPLFSQPKRQKLLD
ncbi:cyclin, partial [Thraustotheca clavata]